ncbi:hypothetical protein SAMN05216371_2532 [Streptomyces sp. TLI_053]|nr:hypothetical protein SAMN05216371_2532 [Streptomyces sp. TLI_053]
MTGVASLLPVAASAGPAGVGADVTGGTGAAVDGVDVGVDDRLGVTVGVTGGGVGVTVAVGDVVGVTVAVGDGVGVCVAVGSASASG